MSSESIAAIATAQGTGGVAVIRISGPSALEIAGRVFVPQGKTAVSDFVPRFMYSGNILAAGGITDYGLCVFFKAPRSFTGEDVVELHCHGGAELSRSVLKAVLAAGARPAKAGEFTMRAFINGKLSLAAAEGMADMINGESSAEVRAGSLLYAGRLTQAAQAVQSVLTDILARIGADTDYPEEDLERTDLSAIREELASARASLESLSATYEGGKKIKSGVNVAICGKPNAGKSSLLNALLGYDRAIVSPSAGTTRDIVEGCIEIGGVKFNLIDTAGIRGGAGEIEKLGIERAKRALASADIALIVYEGAFGAEERDILSQCPCPALKVRNKTDLEQPDGEEDVSISALTGEGIPRLKNLMASLTLPAGGLDGAFVIEERHYAALRRAEDALSSAEKAAGVYPVDIVSVDIKEAWDALGEITGETATEEIIGTIFSKFCVGK